MPKILTLKTKKEKVPPRKNLPSFYIADVEKTNLGKMNEGRELIWGFFSLPFSSATPPPHWLLLSLAPTFSMHENYGNKRCGNFSLSLCVS